MIQMSEGGDNVKLNNHERKWTYYDLFRFWMYFSARR